MMCSYATLDEAALNILKSVEKETGEVVLAYDCFVPKVINEEKVKKLEAVERELCRTLVAVKTEH